MAMACADACAAARCPSTITRRGTGIACRSWFAANPLGARGLQRPARRTAALAVSASGEVKRSFSWTELIGGDLLRPDLGDFLGDLKKHTSLALSVPAEGGIEGRYANTLRRSGYHILNMSARGFGDVEAFLTKVHGVRPPSLGKQVTETFYEPPLLDAREAAVASSPNAETGQWKSGIVLWIQDAKVLSKAELLYLALLAAERAPRVLVVAEVATARNVTWVPLRAAAGMPTPA